MAAPKVPVSQSLKAETRNLIVWVAELRCQVNSRPCPVSRVKARAKIGKEWAFEMKRKSSASPRLGPYRAGGVAAACWPSAQEATASAENLTEGNPLHLRSSEWTHWTRVWQQPVWTKPSMAPASKQKPGSGTTAQSSKGWAWG